MKKFLFAPLFALLFCIQTAYAQFEFASGLTYMMGTPKTDYWRLYIPDAQYTVYGIMETTPTGAGLFMYPKYHLDRKAWGKTSISLGMPISFGRSLNANDYMVDLPLTLDVNLGSCVPQNKKRSSVGFYFGVGFSYTKGSFGGAVATNIDSTTIPVYASVYDFNDQFYKSNLKSFGMLGHTAITFASYSAKYCNNYGLRLFGKLGLNGPTYFGASLFYSRSRN